MIVRLWFTPLREYICLLSRSQHSTVLLLFLEKFLTTDVGWNFNELETLETKILAIVLIGTLLLKFRFGLAKELDEFSTVTSIGVSTLRGFMH